MATRRLGKRIGMELSGTDGSQFDLSIEGWGRSSSKTPHADSDWLNVWVKVKTRDKEWSFSGEHLMHLEAYLLIEWLETVEHSTGTPAPIEFVEPSFSFRVLSRREDEVSLRIYLELGGRPPWAYANSAGRKDLFLDLTLSSVELGKAADSLRAEVLALNLR